MIDALWGAGYYNATVTISIDRREPHDRLDRHRGFRARRRKLPQPRGRSDHRSRSIPARCSSCASIQRPDPSAAANSREGSCRLEFVGLKPGDPAVASDLRAAEARIVDYFRKQSPAAGEDSARSPRSSITRRHTMDVTSTVDPGPIAPFGDATIRRAQHVRSSHRALVPLYPAGRSLFAAGACRCEKSIREIPAVGGVRITEGTTLDAFRRLPYQIDVEDRLPYAVGASAKYSTTNGPAGQVYWEDRNRVRRRRAASPAGGPFLRAALVRHSHDIQQLLDERSSEAAFPQAS